MEAENNEAYNKDPLEPKEGFYNNKDLVYYYLKEDNTY